MTRLEQRRRARLQNPEIASGYRQMDAELSLLSAIETLREELGVSKEELAIRMHRHRSAVSRLLTDQSANPTLDTIVDLLDALGLTAQISLRRREGRDESPIRMSTGTQLLE